MKPNHNNRTSKLGETLQKSFEQFSSGEFKKQFIELLRVEKSPTAIAKAILFLLGGVLTFISFAGLMLGYVRGYKKFMWPKFELPRLHNLPLIVKVAMAVGVVFIWSIIILIIVLGISIELIEPGIAHVVIGFMLANMLLCIPIYFVFRKWRVSVWNLIMEMDKSGSAYIAEHEDLLEYVQKEGLFIGGEYRFADKGHMLLVCGTRGGKSQNVLMANVLMHARLKSSLVYIDPKGEAAAVCARYLRAMGKRVIILNPWDLLNDLIPNNATYNPLDIFADKTSEHLIDDVTLLAELIVPLASSENHNAFFVNSGRELIMNLLLHLITSPKVKNPTLGLLWEWLRLTGDAWNELLGDMYVSDDPIHGKAIRVAASEIAKQMESPETFSSILSNALTSTNFIKSQALQKSMVSGFDPYSLNDGNTVVFLVTPFDKLRSHSNFLRLVVTTLLRAVVRKPSKQRTTFIFDECANLQYISEIETALSGYGGFNASLLLVYQDLPQIMATYDKKWESILANATIRTFMSIKDHFTAEYVSKLAGDKTRVIYSQDWFGNVSEVEATHRPLLTPNEVTRISKTKMIVFTGENPVAILPKIPYYEMPEFKDSNGQNLYDLNPYVENSK